MIKNISKINEKIKFMDDPTREIYIILDFNDEQHAEYMHIRANKIKFIKEEEETESELVLRYSLKGLTAFQIENITGIDRKNVHSYRSELRKKGLMWQTKRNEGKWKKD